jgi:hypothetical protein
MNGYELQAIPGSFMEHIRSIKSGIHYHIRWSSDSSLDWKSFPTEEEATKLAETITKPNESYIIVERGDECERCKMFKAKAL